MVQLHLKLMPYFKKVNSKTTKERNFLNLTRDMEICQDAIATIIFGG